MSKFNPLNELNTYLTNITGMQVQPIADISMINGGVSTPQGMLFLIVESITATENSGQFEIPFLLASKYNDIFTSNIMVTLFGLRIAGLGTTAQRLKYSYQNQSYYIMALDGHFLAQAPPPESHGTLSSVVLKINEKEVIINGN